MIVVLHGWSDSSDSFEALAGRLPKLGLSRPIVPIYLGDYVSMDDDVRFDDIIKAMRRAWADAKLPVSPRSVDLVVHSTGALVARHWMTTYYQPETNPIRRLLMLAPANHGSPLAHKGVSFLGRIFKGYRSRRLFHTGEKILRGLELASPFTWELARRDRFDPARRWYGPGRVLATVLVGTRGYDGIASAANTNGSDGTVLVAGANLDPAYAKFDFATDPDKPTVTLLAPNGATAFCRVPTENHATIACKDGGPRNPLTDDLIRRALRVHDAGFDAHRLDLAQLNGQHRRQEAGDPYTQGYQNTVMCVQDDHGHYVTDYFIELFAKQARRDRVDDALTAALQREVMASVHRNQVNGAFRSLKMNCDVLQELFVASQRPLHLRITAHPEIADTGSVGYSTIAYKDIGSIRIDVNELGRMFRPDRTLYVHLLIDRKQAKDLVRFRRAPRATG